MDPRGYFCNLCDAWSSTEHNHMAEPVADVGGGLPARPVAPNPVTVGRRSASVAWPVMGTAKYVEQAGAYMSALEAENAELRRKLATQWTLCPNCNAGFDPNYKLATPGEDHKAPEIAWEYRGEGLYIYWANPFNEGAKEDLAMFMWPSHSPETTAEVEAIYEKFAETFVKAWNAGVGQ